MLEFQNVTKQYASGQEALRHISFTVERGQMVYITGHSGAGKSTLLRLLARMETPTEGRIMVGDLDVAQLHPKEVPFYRRRLGMIFQTPRLLTRQTVAENVALPLVVAGYALPDLERRVRAALDKVGLLRKADLYPATLSGGEQQRVGIARAIVHRPSMLLADEPTGNLDPSLSLDIMGLFEQFQQVGVTVLIATHDQELIKKLPHRTLHLSQGELVKEGSDAYA